MKKHIAALALLLSFIACQKKDDPLPNDPATEKDSLSMVSSASTVALFLNGKNVTVNWGDGSEKTYLSLDSSAPLTHQYLASTHDKIVIKGTGMSYLNCAGNQISALDMTGNPALKLLNCRNNSLSQTALNSLFTSLHGNANPAQDSVLFYGNPGSAACNVSIATAKGWSTDKVMIDKPAKISFGADHLQTTIAITGTNMIIDWGDGTYNTYATIDAGTPIVHNYSQAIKHWVIIGADVITYFDGGYTGITDLVVSGATGLTYLDCSDSDLYSLDVTKNTALRYLDCSDARLTALDISQNAALTFLDCSSANGYMVNILYKIDATHNPALTHLDCHGSDITIVDVSQNAALTWLDCHLNNRLAVLNLSGNPVLDTLICENTKLSTLDVSANHKLKHLTCFYSALNTLNITGASALLYLDCNHNNLTALDASNAPALQQLNCSNNTIATLNVSNCKQLTQVSCFANKLTSLTMWDNSALKTLWCTDNELSATALNNLFSSLRVLTPPETGFVHYRNPGSATCDNTIAKNKGWTVLND